MSLIKSKQRVADHGEVFTPAWMVDAMLDLVKGETERIDSRFLEPACGSGNFLVRILQRKLAAVELKFGKSDFEKRHYALLALMCTYGIELLTDNISECRGNMLEVFAAYLNIDESDDLYQAAFYVLSQNLIHGDALTMRTTDDQPITFAEWGYLGKGKFQRRDFRLDTLSQMSAANNNGANIWADSSVRFLDPFTKSGVFLREITSRLTKGLATEIPDLSTRVDHILTKQVFGIGITHLTSLLARRSLYCSKHAKGDHSIAKSFASDHGNIWFERTEHTWKDSKCTYCGASQTTLDRGEGLETHAYAFIHTDDITTRVAELFGGSMQFDVIIGNPPYQLDDGGYGTSAAPIYQLFVEQAKALEPRYLSMVIPARWFAGGKGLDEFRESMLSDDRLRSIDDYLSAADVFPGVGLKGGVCYFLWDRDNPGQCRVTTHFKDWPDSTASRQLLEEGADVFIRFNEGVSILKKVVAVETGETDSLSLPDGKRFDQLVSSRKPFGLETTFKGKVAKGDGDVLIYQNGGTGYVARSTISAGTEYIDKWKIYVGRAAPGTGNRDTYPHKIISTPFVGEPGSISSETYLCIGPFDTKTEAENALSYLSCRLTRLLILLHKPSQDTTRKVYTFVPTQEWTKRWTDEDLYTKYGISASEIEFIEKVVRPMDLQWSLLDD